MITIEQLTERKGTVTEDIKKVEETIANLDAQRSQLQANLYALQGAMQQIDFFLEQSQETKEEPKRKTK
jgi:septal ring factor EnvC (AmiA/AmiB activator)